MTRSGADAGTNDLLEQDLASAVFASPRRSGFCTELVGANPPSDDSWLDAQRAAARRGCAIERLVVVGDYSLVHDERVRRLRDLDRSAGVDTRVVAARDVFGASVQPPRGALRYSFWDGQLWCGQANPRERSWTISTAAADVRAARAATAALRRVRDIAASNSEGGFLEEPLLEAASTAVQLAPLLCPGLDGYDCSPYHGVWPHLRVLALAADPDRHRSFFDGALGNLAAAGGFERVLVSGAADQGMLARVACAYAGASKPFETTVIDLCRTPLALVTAYAERHGLRVRTALADVREFTESQPFDVVCTHSLLPRLPASERPGLVERWAALLRPGGKLVTVTRIDPEGEPGPASPSQADAFGDRVRRDAMRWREFLDVSPGELGAAAREYAARTIVYAPPRSPEELADLVTGGGFALERLEVREVSGPSGGRDAAPATARTAVYGEIVASRR